METARSTVQRGRSAEDYDGIIPAEQSGLISHIIRMEAHEIMIILGLHFGHDAGVSVLKDGEIISVIERERFNRVKIVLLFS